MTGGRIDGTGVGLTVDVSAATAWRWWRCCGDAVVEVYSDGVAVGGRYGAVRVLVTVAWVCRWGGCGRGVGFGVSWRGFAVWCWMPG